MTTTDGHGIMCRKPEKNIKPKCPNSWACVPTMKLLEERWGMAAATGPPTGHKSWPSRCPSSNDH